jgi:hypothetical protein
MPNKQNPTAVHRRLRTRHMAMVNEQKHIMPRRDYLSKEQVKKWCHSYTDVTVVKDDLSYREDVFHLQHTKRILMSDLEVFEVRDVGKSGLVIGVAEKCCETMVAYVVSERQCQEVSHK